MTAQPLNTAALTIAGSDSCGGAGIQADLKTFAARGVYGASVITAVTAQNTLGVRSVTPITAAEVRAQLRCVLEDLPVGAIKTGMLGSPDTILAVADTLRDLGPDIPLVMDPVMVATSGATLADPETVAAMQHLVRMASLVTPNLPELARLADCPVESLADAHRAGRLLLDAGASAVLVKGGHLPGDDVTDSLLTRDGEHSWSHPRIDGEFHGTGCTLSAAITAALASGEELEQAIGAALDYLIRAMRGGGLPRAGRLTLLRHHV
ncbi:MAG: bifunctional hydroxymethylpyrimidine kinase/phosphomethylpyrimidine kinase [Xanthomonadales bacterium]|nr:bifunctional hydroxymethylpyrimidine kinase/phosphomethylpyrimidine kinase [Xanthomonadales bacterium]